MKTIRRLYFYAVALVSLEVVIWGVIGLLRSILNPRLITNGAEALAQAIALTLVGIPIFLFHWLWSQRAASREADEKSAGVRAIFLYGVLLATLIPVVQNSLALVNRVLLVALRLKLDRALVGASQTWLDNVIALLINAVAAYYFVTVLRTEWRTLPEKESFADIRRLYRFIWVLYGLLTTVFGAQKMLQYIFVNPVNVHGTFGRELAANGFALLLVGTPLWIYTWTVAQSALSEASEKESNLRLGVLYLLSLSGVITVATAAGNLLAMTLARAFGDDTVLSQFMENIGMPISIGLPFGAMWAYYSRWLNRQIGYDELAPRRAGKRRLYFYILSVIGLTAAFMGTALLISLIIDLTVGQALLGSYGNREQLAGALSAIAVGLPLWLTTWMPMQAEALRNDDLSDHARRSVVRKVYLYLVLFASVIGGMVSAVGLAFTLINAALGGNSSDNFIVSALNGLEFLTLFAILLLYHLSALRKDALARADALEAKQAQIKALIVGDEKFNEAARAAFARHAPKVTLENVGDEMKADVAIMSGSQALAGRLSQFDGIRLIIPDELAGAYWVNDFEQAALIIRAMAEGQDIRPHSSKKNSAWMIVVYVFAALFAIELVFFLFTLIISMVVNV